jgi:ATP-dependent DNA helicase
VDLPKKKEYLLFAPLMPKQKELYDACVRGVHGLRQYMVEKVTEGLQKEKDVDEVSKDNVVDSPDSEEKGNDATDESNSDVSGRRKSKRQSMSAVNYNENVSETKFFEQLEKQVEEDAKKAQEKPIDQPVEKNASKE